jgi:hypothetical protein
VFFKPHNVEFLDWPDECPAGSCYTHITLHLYMY